MIFLEKCHISFCNEFHELHCPWKNLAWTISSKCTLDKNGAKGSLWNNDKASSELLHVWTNKGKNNVKTSACLATFYIFSSSPLLLFPIFPPFYSLSLPWPVFFAPKRCQPYSQHFGPFSEVRLNPVTKLGSDTFGLNPQTWQTGWCSLQEKTFQAPYLLSTMAVVKSEETVLYVPNVESYSSWKPLLVPWHIKCLVAKMG